MSTSERKQDQPEGEKEWAFKAQFPDTPQFHRLVAILRFKRPHMSAAEEEMLDKFIRPYRKEADLVVEEHEGGIVITVQGVGGIESDTLFSCHTDTVHNVGGSQTVYGDPDKGVLFIDPKEGTNCLGADDGAGIFILMEMIDARIPGTYVFHHGEERGGIGSRWFRDKRPEWLKTFKRAVAFDRRKTHSIITHQRGSRCCSDKFAEALAEQLNQANGTFMYVPDDTGLFTDTANYTALIPECSNVSVGYENEHWTGEQLDYNHVMRLRDAVMRVDWEALPTDREAKEETWSWRGYAGRHKGASKRYFEGTYGMGFYDPDELGYEGWWARELRDQEEAAGDPLAHRTGDLLRKEGDRKVLPFRPEKDDERLGGYGKRPARESAKDADDDEEWVDPFAGFHQGPDGLPSLADFAGLDWEALCEYVETFPDKATDLIWKLLTEYVPSSALVEEHSEENPNDLFRGVKNGTNH